MDTTDTTDAGCNIKISDFKGFFDLAFQILSSSEFSWDAFLNALTTFPGLTDQAKADIRTAIEYIQEDPFLVELSRETVNEYLETYGDISLCELIERENGSTDTTPQDTVGGDGADSFITGAGNDTVDGGGGNDFINGGAGNDQLFGGLGSDILIGGLGNDQLYADTLDQLAAVGNGIVNAIWAGLGADSLFGGAARDFLGGGAGNDVISAGGGNDILFGGRAAGGESGGDDSLAGDGGDDIIYASSGNDTVDGGEGDDTLFGGTGNDEVSGGAGDDFLWGGSGDDTLTGGAGEDTFLFAAGSGADAVTDFSAGDDKLDLSNTTFDFTSISDVEGRTTSVDGGIQIDLGGDATLTLEGVSFADLSESNFIL